MNEAIAVHCPYEVLWLATPILFRLTAFFFPLQILTFILSWHCLSLHTPVSALCNQAHAPGRPKRFGPLVGEIAVHLTCLAEIEYQPAALSHGEGSQQATVPERTKRRSCWRASTPLPSGE